MAIRCDTTGDRLTYTGTLFDPNAAYTIMAWVYPVSDDGTTHRTITLTASGANATPHDEINYFLSATLNWEIRNEGSSVTGSVISLDTWTHLTMVRTSDTTILGYFNGALDITNTTGSVTGRTGINELALGGLTAAANRRHDGRIAYAKTWDAALSAAEVVAEMQTIRPQRWANLWGFWPLFPGSDAERARDYSGNGRNYSVNGTLTDEDPPPVPYGAPVLYVNAVPAAGGAQDTPELYGRPDGRRGAVQMAQLLAQ